MGSIPQQQQNQQDDGATTSAPTKSQRVPKPKISADFIYDNSSMKSQRRSVAAAAKRKALEDAATANVQGAIDKLSQQNGNINGTPQQNGTPQANGNISMNGSPKKKKKRTTKKEQEEDVIINVEDLDMDEEIPNGTPNKNQWNREMSSTQDQSSPSPPKPQPKISSTPTTKNGNISKLTYLKIDEAPKMNVITTKQSPPLPNGNRKSNGYLHRGSTQDYLKGAINGIGNGSIDQSHQNQPLQSPILASPPKIGLNHYLSLPSKISMKEDSEDNLPLDYSSQDYLPQDYLPQDDQDTLNEWSQNDETLNSTFFNDDNDSLNGETLHKKGKDKRPTLMTYILKALSEHPDEKSGLADIYEYIKNASERYRAMKTEWRSSVRNCLSSSRRFKKFPRPITNTKQRGNLWGLNPDHPANALLLQCPKDASKFLPRDLPQTPSSVGTKKMRRFEYPTPSDSPPFGNGSLGEDNNSNVSTEDLYIRHTKWTPNRNQPMQQIRIAIMPQGQSYKNHENGQSHQNQGGFLGRRDEFGQKSGSQGQQFGQGQDEFTKDPIQYVYYYPPKDGQSSGYKSFETMEGNSVVYTTPSTTTTYPSASNAHPELSRLLSGPTTPAAISSSSTLHENGNNYLGYSYDNTIVPTQNFSSTFCNNGNLGDLFNNGNLGDLGDLNEEYDQEEYDQENLLPPPLMPKGIDEKEFKENQVNSVYMQL